jgi:hypothetical protein
VLYTSLHHAAKVDTVASPHAAHLLTVLCLCISASLHCIRPFYTSKAVAYPNIDFGGTAYTYTCEGVNGAMCYCSDLRYGCMGAGAIGNDNIGSVRSTYLSTTYMYADFNFGSYMGPIPRGGEVNYNGGNWRNNAASSIIVEVTV